MSAGAPRKVVAVRDYHGAMRVALAGLVAGLAIVAAGCGGSENGATAEPVSAHVGGAAAVSPANASVYAALDTSSGSDQWQQLRKLRGGDELVANALDALGARGLDWERDVRSALGPQTALVVLPGARGGVLLTKPADRAKLDALAARAQPPLATGDVEDGWVALARTHDELDAFRAALARGALADDSGFQNAVADLQGDALVTVYARPGGLTRTLGSVGPGPVAATVSVEHDGLHVEGIAHTAEAHAAYAPELFDRVPADAAAAVSLEGVHGLLASLGT